jgi:hypothetical protein
MDACLMNMIEVGYQLRTNASILVGSEELEPGDGWPYDAILAELVQKPKMKGDELARLIVASYLRSYPASEPVTQSATNLAVSAPLLRAVDALAQSLLAARSDDNVVLGLYRARQKVQAYDVPDYVDLADLCKQIRKNFAAAIAAACDAVERALAQSVLATGYKTKQMAGSTGISIYYPQRDLSPLYKTS